MQAPVVMVVVVVVSVLWVVMTYACPSVCEASMSLMRV